MTMDFPLALKLTHGLLDALGPEYKDRIKQNHRRLGMRSPKNQQVLIVDGYLGQEAISLCVIAKDWRITQVEPNKDFLFAAVRRVEALDLESRIDFEKAPLEEMGLGPFDLCLCSLGHGLLEPHAQSTRLKELAKRLKPNGRLLLTLILDDPARWEAWRAAHPAQETDLKALVQTAPPVNRNTLFKQTTEAGFGPPESWGVGGLVETFSFIKA